MELVPIHKDSSVFSRLEYEVQALTKGSTLKLIRAFDVSNPTLSVHFDRTSKNIQVLDSWIDVDALESPNKEPDVIKRGFQIESNGLIFPVGPMDLFKASSEEKFTKRLMCCRVAVGRSMCVSPDSTPHDLPENYNSCYLDPDGTDNLETLDFCKEDGNGQVVEFVIRNSSQVLPRFVVEIEFDKQLELASRKRIVCDNCEKEKAEIYCHSDSAYFCVGCNDRLHSSKISSRHHRISLDRGARYTLPCRIHADRMAEFFCPSCHVLVCLNCKMVGHHSTGEAMKHPLVSVGDAYQSVIDAASSPDPALDERRLVLKTHLEALEKKGHAILEEKKQIRDTLESMYRKTLHELDEIVKQRLLVLKGDAHEYKRQINEINRCREYMEYLENGRDSTLYLLSWHRYLHAKNNLPLVPSRDFHTHNHNLGLKVVGSLSVVSNAAQHQTDSDSTRPRSSTFSLLSSPAKPGSPNFRSSIYRFGLSSNAVA